MIDRRSLLLTALAGAGTTALAQTPPPALPDAHGVPGLPDPTETIDLWPGDAPGMPARPPAETVEERSKRPDLNDRAVRGVVRPRLVVLRPAQPNGSAVMICPGGGYAHIGVDKEGYEIGRWLTARGFTAFVLFYRLPGDGWQNAADVPLADAQRAMRLIRARSATYGIRPDRIAAMGFSAGGHLCLDVSTRFDAAVYRPVDAADRMSARPDLSAPIYAVQSMLLPVAHRGSRDFLLGKAPTPEMERAHSPDHNVSARTPPTFLVHAEDDPVVSVENSLLYRAALKKAGITVETHLFTAGGHGFGIRQVADKPAGAWPALFAAWARTQGLG